VFSSLQTCGKLNLAAIIFATSCFLALLITCTVSLQDIIALQQQWGTHWLSWAAWIMEYHWRAAESLDFILKFYLYQLQGRVTSLGLLSKYLLIMGLRFDAMLYSSLCNENSDVGLCGPHGLHLAHGPQVSHLCFTSLFYIFNWLLPVLKRL